MRLRVRKVCAHFGIADQIEPALAVAQLFVREACVLIRQGEKGLAEEGQFFDKESQLAFVRMKEMALYADNVAEVDFLFDELQGS